MHTCHGAETICYIQYIGMSELIRLLMVFETVLYLCWKPRLFIHARGSAGIAIHIIYLLLIRSILFDHIHRSQAVQISF